MTAKWSKEYNPPMSYLRTIEGVTEKLKDNSLSEADRLVAYSTIERSIDGLKGQLDDIESFIRQINSDNVVDDVACWRAIRIIGSIQMGTDLPFDYPGDLTWENEDEAPYIEHPLYQENKEKEA